MKTSKSTTPLSGEDILASWRADIKKQRTTFRKQIHDQLRAYQKATDEGCVSCACQQCSADPSVPQANLIGNEDGDTYVWGDPFPIQTGALGGIVLLTAPPDTGAALPDPC
jgi:hypothetical protein